VVVLQVADKLTPLGHAAAPEPVEAFDRHPRDVATGDALEEGLEALAFVCLQAAANVLKPLDDQVSEVMLVKPGLDDAALLGEGLAGVAEAERDEALPAAGNILAGHVGSPSQGGRLY